MLKDVRRHAGLGDPPTAYYNNIPESANAMIKRAVNFKESEMTKFCENLSTFLLQQKEDIDSSILNHGPYRLASNFSSFQVSSESWFKMNINQKESALKKFHAAKMSDSDDVVSNTTNNGTHLSSPQDQISLSVDLDQLASGIASIPRAMLKGIGDKAKALLGKEGSVQQAPGCQDNTAFVVESRTSDKPHFVTLSKNGKIKCEDCPGWRASNICAHAIAVAEKSGTTARYLKWLREKGPKSMNVTSLVTFDSVAGIGRKGAKNSTARRKGGRTRSQAPVSTTIDRAVFTATSTCTQPPITSTTGSTPEIFSMPGPHAQHLLRPPAFTSPPPLQPNSMFVLGLLAQCPHLVRVCFGCSQTLKPDGKIANPPFDMTIITQMNRQFRATPNGELMSRTGNVYFHVEASCIKRKQPYFASAMVQIPPSLTPYLMPVHLQYLREFGVRF